MKFQNLDTVEPWKAGSMPPPGNYTARIDEAVEGQSSGGYDQLELSWTVVGGEYDGAEIREWLVVTDTTRGKVVALLQAVGIEIPSGDFELKVDDLAGKTAEIIVRKEPSYKDPSKMRTVVAGHREAPNTPVSVSNGSDVTPDTSDLPF